MARKKTKEEVVELEEEREANMFDKIASFLNSVAVVSSAVADAVDAYKDIEEEWSKSNDDDEEGENEDD